MKKKSSKAGLTLIEVMLALVILSIGVSSLMVSMARCLSVVRTARHRVNARALFQQVEVENPLTDVEMSELAESGDFEKMEGYTWEREITMVDLEERPGLFLVRTRIGWTERGRDTFEEVYAYRYAPDAEVLTSEF